MATSTLACNLGIEGLKKAKNGLTKFDRNEVRSRVSFRRAELKSYKVSFNHMAYTWATDHSATLPPFLLIILQNSGGKIENDLLWIY